MDKTLYTDLSNYLPGALLVKADRMTMANSIEGRSPLLDYKVVEFSNRLPEEFKLRGSTHKYMLKRAFGHLLPPDVLKRGKVGFGIPVGEWFRSSLKDMAYDLLLSPTFANRAIFKKEAIRKMLDEHVATRNDHGKRIWALVMLEFWFQTYIDQSSAQ